MLGQFLLRDRLASEGIWTEAQIERQPVDGGFDLRRGRIGLRLAQPAAGKAQQFGRLRRRLVERKKFGKPFADGL